MENSSRLDDKYYRRLLLPAGVIAFVLVFVLVWAEKNSDWMAAQASLVTILLLMALMLWGWWAVGHPSLRMSHEAKIYHRVIQKLLVCDAIGLFAVVFNATRLDRWQNGIVAKAIGFGTLAVGAFFVLGVLFGYLFGLRPTGAHQSLGGAQSSNEHPTPTKSSGEHPSTNLEEIADWFTKLILGAGLVSLTSLRGPIGQFAKFMAHGVDPPPPKQDLDPGSPAFALAIMLFFSASGILYGYLWTRYELAASHRPNDEAPAPAGGPPVEPADSK